METLRSNFLRWGMAFMLSGLLFSVTLSSCDTNDECEGRSLCINGVFQGISNCTCFCLNEWEGTSCDECNLTDEDCFNGFADTERCRCECDPEWCGEDCDIPVLTCENGGTWNSFTCGCDCEAGWAGAVCDSMI